MLVAVTGGAGFLGSHVAAGFAAHGHDVYVIDISQSQQHPTTTVDVAETDALAPVLRNTDVVCHLAGVGDVYLAAGNPRLAAHANVTGTASLCEAARRAKVGCVVYASTWEVYGRPIYEPMDEKHPCNPEHPYSITKLAGKRMALAAGRAAPGGSRNCPEARHCVRRKSVQTVRAPCSLTEPCDPNPL